MHFVVEGRVQGVGFRWFVKEQAEKLSLCGWVKNLNNGSVELEAEGKPSAIELFKMALKEGPSAARVDTISFNEVSEQNGTEFRVI